MLYKLGRVLQTFGLILLPIAMAGEVTQSLSLGQMLVVASAGVILFMLGWMLQQSAGKS